MKQLFTFAVAAATAAVTLAPEAKAEITRGTILGYNATVLRSGSYTKPDFIEIVGPNGKEIISVTCAPFDWESTGPNTVNWVNSVATKWCAS